MATGKRYYWMKLKDTFMTSDTVDFLMGQPNGANYVVLYQMLCLKTINTGGKLSRQIGEILIPYDEQKIARDTKWFTVDTVRVALELYKALGLIYQDVDGNLVLVDHENLVGSETDYAERNRRLRAEHKEALPVHDVYSDEYSDVSQNVSIDIRDKDNRYKEIDTRDKEIKILDNREKDSNIIYVDKPPQKKFIPPDVGEVKAYCLEKGYQIDAERFVDYYTSNGWKVGRNSMKDWKAAVRTWAKNGTQNKNEKQGTNNPFLRGLMRGVDDEEE